MNWNVNTELFISWLKNTWVDPNINFCISVIYILWVNNHFLHKWLFKWEAVYCNGLSYLQTSHCFPNLALSIYNILDQILFAKYNTKLGHVKFRYYFLLLLFIIYNIHKPWSGRALPLAGPGPRFGMGIVFQQ